MSDLTQLNEEEISEMTVDEVIFTLDDAIERKMIIDKEGTEGLVREEAFRQLKRVIGKLTKEIEVRREVREERDVESGAEMPGKIDDIPR